MSAGSIFGRGMQAGRVFTARGVHHPIVRQKGSEFAEEFFTEMYYDLQAEQMGIKTSTGHPTVGGVAYQAVKDLLVKPGMSDSARAVLLPRSQAAEEKARARQRINVAVVKSVPLNPVAMTHLIGDTAFVGAFNAHCSSNGSSPELSSFIQGKLDIMNIQMPDDSPDTLIE